MLRKIKIKIKALIKEFLYSKGFLIVRKEDGYFYHSAISLIFAKHRYFLKKLDTLEKNFLTFLIDQYPKGSSQRSQDLFALWVNSFVNKNNNNKFCIEFGAADGDFISNTKYLSTLKYKSLLIEPSKTFFRKLVKNRPNDICLNYVIKSTDDNLNKVLFYDSGLYSSSVKSDDDNFKKNFQKAYKVRQKDLNSILSEYVPSVQNFSYLSMDVEGTELEIIKKINFKKYSFNCLTIECDINNVNRSSIINILNKNNYQSIFDKDQGITGVDLWFIHKKIYNKIIKNHRKI